MMTCEDHEILISTFLDGELGREEAGVMLDHLIGCESCRAFYRAAQGLQEAVQPLVSGHRNPPPAELWDRIESRSRPRRYLSGRFQGVADWGWKAAAVLLVVFGLWQIGRIRTESGPGAPGPGGSTAQVSAPAAAPGAMGGVAPAAGQPTEVVLGGEPGRMTDARFLEMTRELLGADRRYHQAMFQVMREVQKTTRSPEAPPEDILRDPRRTDGGPVGEPAPGLPS